MQLASYTMHLARIASSASSSKQMVISLEKTIKEKEIKLLKVRESIKTKEDQLQLAAERENQLSNSLNEAKTKITELERN